MSIFPLHFLDTLLHEYGYAAVFLCLLLESTGFPLPGESLMIGAALYASTKHGLNIFVLIPVAAAGAISGDQIGYVIGRLIGFRVLSNWGRKIGLSEERLELGRFLFRKYGPRVVFFGRFIAVLRTLAALLAGANKMPWHTFLLWNALGGIGWTCLYGFGAYILGDAAKRVSGPIGIVLGVIGAAALIAAVVYVKRHETELMSEAGREMKRAPIPERQLRSA